MLNGLVSKQARNKRENHRLVECKVCMVANPYPVIDVHSKSTTHARPCLPKDSAGYNLEGDGHSSETKNPRQKKHKIAVRQFNA
jgi:Fe-S-cluster-containing hydrogenase component 2